MSGVILRHPPTGCRALVRADAAERQVRIHIDGTAEHRRDLLAIVRHNFDVIHADHGFTPDDSESPIPVLQLFLSYSHKDEKHVEELREDLKLMERNGLIRTWYDRAISVGEKWEARILQELAEADVIVCQISHIGWDQSIRSQFSSQAMGPPYWRTVRDDCGT